MFVSLDNNDGYNVKIEMSPEDKEKKSEDLIYDFLSLIATFVGSIQSDIYDLDSVEEKKKSAFAMLDGVKHMMNMYYEEMEQLEEK